MRPVCGTLGENIGPTAGNLEGVTTYSQELQNAFRRVIYTRNKFLKFFEFMQCPIRLPPLSRRQLRPISPHPFKRRQNLRIYRFVLLHL